MPNLTDLYKLDQFNDTFALGHYARVLDALDRRTGHLTALKVLRPEHLTADGDMPSWRAAARKPPVRATSANKASWGKRSRSIDRPHRTGCTI